MLYSVSQSLDSFSYQPSCCSRLSLLMVKSAVTIATIVSSLSRGGSEALFGGAVGYTLAKTTDLIGETMSATAGAALVGLMKTVLLINNFQNDRLHFSSLDFLSELSGAYIAIPLSNFMTKL